LQASANTEQEGDCVENNLDDLTLRDAFEKALDCRDTQNVYFYDPGNKQSSIVCSVKTIKEKLEGFLNNDDDTIDHGSTIEDYIEIELSNNPTFYNLPDDECLFSIK
jgi:hypothetical protein